MTIVPSPVRLLLKNHRNTESGPTSSPEMLSSVAISAVDRGLRSTRREPSQVTPDRV